MISVCVFRANQIRGSLSRQKCESQSRFYSLVFHAFSRDNCWPLWFHRSLLCRKEKKEIKVLEDHLDRPDRQLPSVHLEYLWVQENQGPGAHRGQLDLQELQDKTAGRLVTHVMKNTALTFHKCANICKCSVTISKTFVCE